MNASRARGSRRPPQEGRVPAQAVHPYWPPDRRRAAAFTRREIRHRHRLRAPPRRATPSSRTYVTDSAYTEDIPGRSNVGDMPGHFAPRHPGRRNRRGDVGRPWPARTPPPARRTGPRACSQDRASTPVWSEDGTKAVISARAADNKDRWIFALDPATGKTRVLVHDHDDAWIGGPAQTPSAG